MLIIVKYYYRVNFYALSLTCIVYSYQYGFTLKSQDCLGEPQGQSDTGVVVGGCPWIVQDGLGILGVRGYSDTGVVVDGHPWIVQDGLGILGHSCLDILGMSSVYRTWLLGLPRIVQDCPGLSLLVVAVAYVTWTSTVN